MPRVRRLGSMNSTLRHTRVRLLVGRHVAGAAAALLGIPGFGMVKILRAHRMAGRWCDSDKHAPIGLCVILICGIPVTADICAGAHDLPRRCFRGRQEVAAARGNPGGCHYRLPGACRRTGGAGRAARTAQQALGAPLFAIGAAGRFQANSRRAGHRMLRGCPGRGLRPPPDDPVCRGSSPRRRYCAVGHGRVRASSACIKVQ